MPVTEQDIIDAARLACASWALGSAKTKREPQQDMRNLKAMIAAYDAAQETQAIQRGKHD